MTDETKTEETTTPRLMRFGEAVWLSLVTAGIASGRGAAYAVTEARLAIHAFAYDSGQPDAEDPFPPGGAPTVPIRQGSAPFEVPRLASLPTLTPGEGEYRGRIAGGEIPVRMRTLPDRTIAGGPADFQRVEVTWGNGDLILYDWGPAAPGATRARETSAETEARAILADHLAGGDVTRVAAPPPPGFRRLSSQERADRARHAAALNARRRAANVPEIPHVDEEHVPVL